MTIKIGHDLGIVVGVGIVGVLKFQQHLRARAEQPFKTGRNKQFLGLVNLPPGVRGVVVDIDPIHQVLGLIDGARAVNVGQIVVPRTK